MRDEINEGSFLVKNRMLKMFDGFWYGCVLCLFTVFTIVASASAVAMPPQFDKFLGEYSPPDYIPIDVTADIDGNIYVLDIYHKRVRKLNQSGDLLNEFSVPGAKWLRGIEVDSNGNIYLVDAAGATSGINNNSNIRKFDQAGNELLKFSASDRGIGIDGNDIIYTANEKANLVYVRDTNGVIIREIGNGVLSKPEDVDATADGSLIYVADAGNARIAVFNALGDFLFSWGSFGQGDQQFRNPVSISVDSDGNVFVTDRRNYKIKKFDANGNLLASVGGQGLGNGLFQEPHGHGVDPFGNLWQATYHGHDIQKFDNNLNYILTVSGNRSAIAEFADVRGVAVDSKRNVWVADKWLQRVTQFDRDGNYLSHFGLRGQGDGPEFNFPRTVHIDVNDNMYVSDDGDVRKFDSKGNYLTRYGRYLYIQGLATDSSGNQLFMARTSHDLLIRLDQTTLEEKIIATRGSAPGEVDGPWGIAIGPNGKLYVADSNNSRVQRFDQDGNFEMTWGTNGSGEGDFQVPTALAIDSQGNVYVADARNDNIQVFDENGVFQYRWGTRGSAPSQFGKIWSLAIEEGSAIYAGDVLNSSVQRFTFEQELIPVGYPDYVLGSDRGFYLGRDEFNNWELNWVGNGVRDEFSGVVFCDQPIVSVSPFRYEKNDSLVALNESFSFSGIVISGDDGLRFRTTPGTQCTFDLRINGVSQSAFIHVGRQGDLPVKLPFSLTSTVVSDEVIDPVGIPVYELGVDRGLFIGRDDYNNWVVNWVSNGSRDEYVGSINCDKPVSSVVSYRYESNDTLSFSEGKIDFSGVVIGGDDGLRFKTSPSAECLFIYTVNGVSTASSMYIGSNKLSPSILPVSLSSNTVLLESVISNGKPVYTPGVDLGVFLWYEEKNSIWKLRFSSDSQKNYIFSGNVTTDGVFQSAVAVQNELQDIVIIEESNILFDMKAASHQDGINFKTLGAGWVTFDIQLDGVAFTGSVSIGEASSNPSAIPFTLQAK